MGDVPGSGSSERPDSPRDGDLLPAAHLEAERPLGMPYPNTNGTAVMALVATLVPLPFVSGILGVVLGIFGLREIRKYGQTGAAIAVAAIVLGGIQLAIVIISLLVIVLAGLPATIQGRP